MEIVEKSTKEWSITCKSITDDDKVIELELHFGLYSNNEHWHLGFSPYDLPENANSEVNELYEILEGIKKGNYYVESIDTTINNLFSITEEQLFNLKREFIQYFTKIDLQYQEDRPNLTDYTYEQAVEYFDKLKEDELDYDFSDEPERCFALGQELGLSLSELQDIEIDENRYSPTTYKYGEQEWYVLEDDEADKLEEEYVESMIDECYIAEFEAEERKTGRSNPLLQYLDKDKWIEDWCGNRGENLSGYDRNECEQKVNDTWYFLYRQN